MIDDFEIHVRAAVKAFHKSITWLEKWLTGVIVMLVGSILLFPYLMYRADGNLSKRITALERRVTAAERTQAAPKPAALRLEPRGGLPALEWAIRKGEKP